MKFSHDMFTLKGSDKSPDQPSGLTKPLPKLPSRPSKWALLSRARSKSVNNLRPSISSPSSFVHSSHDMIPPPPVPPIPTFPSHIHPTVLNNLRRGMPANALYTTPPNSPPERPPRSPARNSALPPEGRRPSSPTQRLFDAANVVVGPHPIPSAVPPLTLAPRLLALPELGEKFVNSFDLEIPWVTEGMTFGLVLPGSQTQSSLGTTTTTTGSGYSTPMTSPTPSTFTFTDPTTGSTSPRSQSSGKLGVLHDITNLPLNVSFPVLFHHLPPPPESTPLLEGDGKYPKPSGGLMRPKASSQSLKALRKGGRKKENEVQQSNKGTKVRDRAATVTGAGGSSERGFMRDYKAVIAERRKGLTSEVMGNGAPQIPKSVLGLADRSYRMSDLPPR